MNSVATPEAHLRSDRVGPSWAALALVALAAACGGADPSSEVPDASLPDGGLRAPTVDPRTGIVHEVGSVRVDPSWLVLRSCAPSDAGLCEAEPGRYVPVADGESVAVWRPSDGRYVNEPTLVRTGDGTWHAFANGAAGNGDPWRETSLLHASAPTLGGPWRDEPDALAARDPGAPELQLWAPFAAREGDGWSLYYFAHGADDASWLRSARSPDLRTWTRDPETLPAGRDATVFTRADGTRLMYSVGLVQRADGEHDVVLLHASNDGRTWRAMDPALEQPRPCRASCWGFYESPFVVALGGMYFLFTTYTDSSPRTYEQTAVFRSADPTRFEQPPVAVLRAHGGEVHTEGGRVFLTGGGWPGNIGEARRGMSRTPLAWAREP